MAKTPTTKKCYQDHLPLVVVPGKPSVVGGSCLVLQGPAFDVRVGLDAGMAPTHQRLPWVPGHEVYFPIDNMRAPTDPAEFGRMITWLLEQIRAGARVHVGCIGGHGRTGMVLAALVAKAKTGVPSSDPIGYARARYCKKAVETDEQIEFLVRHYGALSVKPWIVPAAKKKRVVFDPESPCEFFGGLDEDDRSLFDLSGD